MLVVKFGGTSVGKPERMKKIADLVLAMPGKKIVVLSALSGTTNALVRMGEHLIAQQQTAALQEITDLEKNYLNFTHELFSTSAYGILSARPTSLRAALDAIVPKVII